MLTPKRVTEPLREMIDQCECAEAGAQEKARDALRHLARLEWPDTDAEIDSILAESPFCTHPAANVTADILEGNWQHHAIEWCRLCGAWRPRWLSHPIQTGQWRTPDA